ncbi:MAG: hypothetical protein F4213_21105 [Boseongicola sp. SB0677_bin_26]|nr:hypothetical protein [Boseongicola sp. SB0677_bin_26]
MAFVRLTAIAVFLAILSDVGLAQTGVDTQFDKVQIGQVIEERFDIADIRIGSRDADKSDNSTYTAPIGFTILGHRIFREGHHSGVRHISTINPGKLSYESSAVISLMDAVRKGFVEGLLTSDSSNDALSGAKQYANFLKQFDGKYKFVAETHASITFRWHVDSKSFDHGAALKAHAIVRLQKSATESDVRRATELIRYALESGERHAVLELIDDALNVHRSSD